MISGQSDFVNLPTDEEIIAVAKTACEKLELDENLEIEIIFSSKDEIAVLNKEHRKIDKATDVLSFPQAQIEGSELNILGSIVICPPVAEEKNEKIEELVKHGILHLCGYDHETDEATWDKFAKIIGSEL